jgi:hypothetical protein
MSNPAQLEQYHHHPATPTLININELATKFEVQVKTETNSWGEIVNTVKPIGVINDKQRADRLVGVLRLMLAQSPNVILSLGMLGGITDQAAREIAQIPMEARQNGSQPQLKLVHVLDPRETRGKKQKVATELNVTAPGAVFIHLGLIDLITNQGPLQFAFRQSDAVNSFK